MNDNNYRKLKPAKIEEIELIKDIISEIEGVINLSKKYNQNLTEKFRELDIKKRLLKEIIQASELKIIKKKEIELKDIWKDVA